MGYKRIMLATLMLLFILTVGAVSASDNATSDKLAVSDDVNLELNDNDKLLVDDSSDVISDIGNGTFTPGNGTFTPGNGTGMEGTFDELETLINSTGPGTLELTKDYYAGNGTIAGITIPFSSMTIDGQGHTLDARGFTNIFTVKGTNVTLKNINFINAGDGSTGNAILWDGSYGQLSNCNFTNCQGSKGSAVYWGSDYGTMTKCIFSNCTSDSNRGIVWWGGSNGLLSDCIFSNCIADDGGAVYWNENNGIITKTKFVNITASNGGAVYWQGDEGNLTLCSFENCNAENGGAIYWNGWKGNVIDSTFVNCSAIDGGAIYWNNNFGTVSNSMFTNTTATRGGAVYWTREDGNIISSTFDYCSLPGATVIYVVGQLKVKESEFTNDGNETLYDLIYGTTNIINCTLNGKLAQLSKLGMMLSSNITVCKWGDEIVFTTMVYCDGPDDAANAYAQFMMPSSLEIIDDDPETGAFDRMTGIWDIGTLTDSAMVRLTLTCRVRQVGNITVTALVDSDADDTNTTDNYAALDIISSKADATLIFEHINETSVGESILIIIHAPANATGNVSMNISDSNGSLVSQYDLLIYDGTAILNATGFAAGTYIVTAVYTGDDNYTGALNTTVFTVNRVDANLRANITTIYSNALIMVILPSDATGNISIPINNMTYMRDIEDENVLFNITDLDPGIYNTLLIYTGDSKYLPSLINITFEITKEDVNLTIEISDIIYGDNATAMITMSTDDTITVNLNGINYNLTITDGMGILSLPKLYPGDYAITATFNGNSRYNPKNAIKMFTVLKADPQLAVNVNDTHYGENITILVTVLPDATGIITLSINNTNYTGEIINGKALFSISGLDIGTFTATASYPGDIGYTAATANATFKVRAKNFEDLKNLIDAANPGDIIELDDDYINDGSVSADGITISKAITIDGKGHTLNANGNSRAFNINANGVLIKNTKFINGHQSNTGSAIYWSDCCVSVVNCTFINNAADYDGGAIGWTGSGSANSSVSDCTFINNTAKMGGGAIYCSWSDNWSITNCFIENSYARYDGGAVITWGVNNGLISNCTFQDNSAGRDGETIFWYNGNGNIDNSNFININQHGGKVIHSSNNDAIISNSAFVDETVESLDDIIYGGTVINCTLNGKLPKVTATMEITVKDIEYGETATINITLPSDATGNISISIGGKNYLKMIVGGKVTLSISNLDVGNYTVHAEYFGDDKYLPVDDSITFTVNPKGIKTFTDLKNLIDNALPQSTIELDDDYINDGSVSEAGITISKAITIDGKGHTLDANKLSRIFHIQADNIVLRNITFNNGYSITNGGGVYFNGISACAVYNCTFENCSANRGGAIYLKISNTLGSAYNSDVLASEFVSANGVTYCVFTDCSAVESGGSIYWEANEGRIERSRFINSNAPVGKAIYATYNVAVSNSDFETEGSETIDDLVCGGDVTNCTINGNETDKKEETATTVEINADIIHIGESISITPSVKDKNGNTVSGKVEIFINGASIGSIDANKALIQYPELGTYNVFARFNGDETYERSTSASKTFTVIKKTPQITVNVVEIEVGQDKNINITLPDDATGKVNITLYNNGRVIQTATYDLNKGKASETYSNLALGVYNVTIEYSGDDNYYGAKDCIIFMVRPHVEISKNVVVGDDVRIIIDNLANTTGKIQIYVDEGLELAFRFENQIDCNLTTKYFTARNHTVTFKYEGNSFDANIFNYWDKLENRYVPFGYDMYLEPINITVKDQVASDNAGVVDIELPDDAKGTIEVFINGVSVKVVDVINGVAKIDLSAYKDGKYTITLKYSGDDKYAAFSQTSQASVKNNVPAKITAKALTMVYSSGTKYSVTVMTKTNKCLSGVTVNFLINGKSYGKAKTNSKGVASIKITKVPGSYKITAKVNKISTTKALKVKHILTLKTAKVKRSAKKLVLQASLAKVNKKYLKNKKITFKFNGKKYTAKTNKKGVAKVTIKSKVLKKLKKGKKIKYQATYLKDTVKKTAKVKK